MPSRREKEGARQNALQFLPAAPRGSRSDSPAPGHGGGRSLVTERSHANESRAAGRSCTQEPRPVALEGGRGRRMKSGSSRRIGVLDLSGERSDLVRALLLPLGAPTLVTQTADLSACDAEIVLVDPPATGLTPSRLRTVLRAAGTRPVLVLGSL